MTQSMDVASSSRLLNPHPLTLRFADRPLEQAYQRSQLTAGLGMLGAMYLFGIGIHVLFSIVDYVVLGSDAVGLWVVRFGIVIPMQAFGYGVRYRPLYARCHEAYILVPLMITGLMMPFSGLISQTALVYMLPGTSQVCFFAFFLCGLRFQVSCPVAWLLFSLNLSVAYVLSDTPMDTVVDGIRVLAGSLVIMTVATYRMEYVTRRAYRDSLALDELKAAQDVTEQKRLQWLEQMATFLRHELRTAMSGLGTSVELIERRTDPQVSGPYIQRCRQSLQTVNTLLEAVAQASSIEAAVTQSQKQYLDLDRLVHNQVEGYREIYPCQDFTVQLPNSVIQIVGNDDRLCQLLDNLVMNAVEHAANGTSIAIHLFTQVNTCYLSICNEGRLLPDEPDRLFELFHSVRDVTFRQDHVGLGLYVVKLIAEWHGGSVSACNCTQPEGVEFTVTLPMPSSG